jgi:hypothetical protein
LLTAALIAGSPSPTLLTRIKAIWKELCDRSLTDARAEFYICYAAAVATSPFLAKASTDVHGVAPW